MILGFNHRASRNTAFEYYRCLRPLLFLFIMMSFFIYRPAQAASDLSGFVFEDFDLDHEMDEEEPGIAAVLVVAEDDDGNLFETETDSLGMYSISGLTGDHIKVGFYLPESESLNSKRYRPVLGGHTIVQFGTMADGSPTQMDAGFFSPARFESENLQLVTPCYVSGDPLQAAPDGWGEVPVHSLDAVVSFPYQVSGAPGEASYQAPHHLNYYGEVGTVWGLAYDPDRYLLYQAAFLKRHSGLGPLGLGGIYMVDFSAGIQNSWFVDLAEMGVELGSVDSRDLSFDPKKPSVDAAAFDLVGKVGLGDIDISPDGETLYIMNLYGREVIALGTSTKEIEDRYPIPDLDCTNGETRPFALKVDTAGDLYAGAVCSTENDGTASDLEAHVLQLIEGEWQSIFAFKLDQFNRGLVNGSLDKGDWNPWTSQYTQLNNAYPVPVFSDIEFDEDGSLIMAFFDRTGHNTGNGEYRPDGDELITLTSGGDVLRACRVEDAYYIEGTPEKCEQSQPRLEGQGIEYYTGLYKTPHFETGLGSLALLPSSGEVVATVYSPINY